MKRFKADSADCSSSDENIAHYREKRACKSPEIRRCDGKRAEATLIGAPRDDSGVGKLLRIVEEDMASWEYVGSGNAHFVFAYTGAGAVPGWGSQGLALRVRKSWLLPMNKTQRQRIAQEAAHVAMYTRELVSTVLGGPPVAPAGRLVAISRAFGLRLYRGAPDRMRALDGLPMDPPPDGDGTDDWDVPAILVSNAMRFPKRRSGVFALELKPKWGYIPRHRAVKPSARTCVTAGICQHCLLQPIKLRRGKVKGLSQYCPIDMYSADKTRVERAVKGLLQTPQNNLQIHTPDDSEPISPSKVKSVLVSILKHPFTTKLLRRMAAAQLYFDHEKGAVGARSEFEKLQSVSGGDVSAALLEHESTEWMQSTVAEFQEYFSSGGGVGVRQDAKAKSDKCMLCDRLSRYLLSRTVKV